MTYNPYEAAGTQTTVPPMGYGMPPYGTPQPGSAGGDFGPVTQPQGTAPSKTKWAMVIGASAAVIALGVGAAFLVKPGPSPSPAAISPAPISHVHHTHTPADNGQGTNTQGTNTQANTQGTNTQANTQGTNTQANTQGTNTQGSTGNSPAPQPTDTAAEVNEYLDEVDSQGGDFDYVSDSDLLSLGNAACADFEEGDSVDATVDDALDYAANDSDGLDDQDMGVILGAATDSLCQAYGPEVQSWAQGPDDD
jgi:hypothetical protein